MEHLTNKEIKEGLNILRTLDNAIIAGCTYNNFWDTTCSDKVYTKLIAKRMLERHLNRGNN